MAQAQSTFAARAARALFMRRRSGAGRRTFAALCGGVPTAEALIKSERRSRYPKIGCNSMHRSENLAAPASRRLGRAGLEAPPLRGQKILSF